ncbi:MAG: IS110 family transposase [Actinobacteria bacterium]|nr:IS110 family transposase [Actinomycetota bacterium]
MGWTVAIGIDTHRDSHVAVALDRLAGARGSLAVSADAKGYLLLWRWAQELGEPAFAIEGTGSYGAGLARFLVSAGAEVYECERPRRAERRRGKSDLIDATLAAGRLLQDRSLPRVRGGGEREDLRLLLLERRGAVRARTAALNQLQAVVVTAPEALRSRLRGLSGQQLARVASRLRTAEEGAVIAGVLRRLGRRVRELGRELDELDSELEAIVIRLVPELLEESGVGPVCAAQLVVSSGDPTRMASEASFAALAGTSPVQASSGLKQRHRLNRGGDRQLNRALHVIALNRVRWHAQTAAYNQKLIASGKSPREARRCVKRMLARYFHRRLQMIPALDLTP